MNDETTQAEQTNTDTAPETDATAPAEGVSTTGEPAEKEAETSPQAPESYEPFKLPEGVGEMRPETHERVSEYLKEYNLPQDAGQKMVDLHMDLVAQMNEAQQASHDETVSGWIEEAKADPEIGGEDFDEKLGLARRVLDGFGEPLIDEETKKPVFDKEGRPVTKFGDILNKSSFGNHPELIRIFSRIGEAISEDKLPQARSVGESEPPSEAHVMFPSMRN